MFFDVLIGPDSYRIENGSFNFAYSDESSPLLALFRGDHNWHVGLCQGQRMPHFITVLILYTNYFVLLVSFSVFSPQNLSTYWT
ncbi:MAG: hypothetical protein RLZZ543_1163 [Bacteroidota bacterium]